MVNLFDLAKTIADFGHQIGFVFGFNRAAELVDGGVGLLVPMRAKLLPEAV